MQVRYLEQRLSHILALNLMMSKDINISTAPLGIHRERSFPVDLWAQVHTHHRQTFLTQKDTVALY